MISVISINMNIKYIYLYYYYYLYSLIAINFIIYLCQSILTIQFFLFDRFALSTLVNYNLLLVYATYGGMWVMWFKWFSCIVRGKMIHRAGGSSFNVRDLHSNTFIQFNDLPYIHWYKVDTIVNKHYLYMHNYVMHFCK